MNIRQWSLAAWLVFWGMLVAVLSITLLVQARERPPEQPEHTDDTAEMLQPWAPFAVQEGIATWYGPGFHGRRAASGLRYNMYELTAAHRSFPFGTLVRVTVPGQEKVIVVQVTDRGPFIRRRIIDLSWAAASALGVRRHPVRIEAFLPPQDPDYVLGFRARWEPYVIPRRALVLLDTVESWTEAVQRWERSLPEFPQMWLLVSWMPGSDSAAGAQPYRLWFHRGVQRGTSDSLLALLRSG